MPVETKPTRSCYENPEPPIIEIADNGKGLPKADRNRLTEPYVTTRDRGTGLGLAIVKKIMEDHGGELMLRDRPGGGGAQVTLQFPRRGGQRSGLAGDEESKDPGKASAHGA